MPLALLLDSVGTGEWLLLFLVALVVYGPRRLPGLARSLGRWIARINQAAEQLREQVSKADLDGDDAHAKSGDTAAGGAAEENLRPPETDREPPAP